MVRQTATRVDRRCAPLCRPTHVICAALPLILADHNAVPPRSARRTMGLRDRTSPTSGALLTDGVRHARFPSCGCFRNWRERSASGRALLAGRRRDVTLSGLTGSSR